MAIMCGFKGNKRFLLLPLILVCFASCNGEKERGEYTAINVQYFTSTVIQLPRILSFNPDNTCLISFSSYSPEYGWLEDNGFTVTVDYQIEDEHICIYDFYVFEKRDGKLHLVLLDKDHQKMAEILYEKTKS